MRKWKTWKVSGGLVFVYIWPSFDFRSLGLGTTDVSDVSEGVTSTAVNESTCVIYGVLLPSSLKVFFRSLFSIFWGALFAF